MAFNSLWLINMNIFYNQDVPETTETPETPETPMETEAEQTETGEEEQQ